MNTADYWKLASHTLNTLGAMASAVTLALAGAISGTEALFVVVAAAGISGTALGPVGRVGPLAGTGG